MSFRQKLSTLRSVDEESAERPQPKVGSLRSVDASEGSSAGPRKLGSITTDSVDYHNSRQLKRSGSSSGTGILRTISSDDSEPAKSHPLTKQQSVSFAITEDVQMREFSRSGRSFFGDSVDEEEEKAAAQAAQAARRAEKAEKAAKKAAKAEKREAKEREKAEAASAKELACKDSVASAASGLGALAARLGSSSIRSFHSASHDGEHSRMARRTAVTADPSGAAAADVMMAMSVFAEETESAKGFLKQKDLDIQDVKRRDGKKRRMRLKIVSKDDSVAKAHELNELATRSVQRMAVIRISLFYKQYYKRRHRMENWAASLVQRVWRGNYARKSTLKFLAARCIQYWWRTHLHAIREARAALMLVAVVAIQRRYMWWMQHRCQTLQLLAKEAQVTCRLRQLARAERARNVEAQKRHAIEQKQRRQLAMAIEVTAAEMKERRRVADEARRAREACEAEERQKWAKVLIRKLMLRKLMRRRLMAQVAEQQRAEVQEFTDMLEEQLNNAMASLPGKQDGRLSGRRDTSAGDPLRREPGRSFDITTGLPREQPAAIVKLERRAAPSSAHSLRGAAAVSFTDTTRGGGGGSRSQNSSARAKPRRKAQPLSAHSELVSPPDRDIDMGATFPPSSGEQELSPRRLHRDEYRQEPSYAHAFSEAWAAIPSGGGGGGQARGAVRRKPGLGRRNPKAGVRLAPQYGSRSRSPRAWNGADARDVRRAPLKRETQPVWNCRFNA